MHGNGSYARALIALALIGCVPFADLAASGLPGAAPGTGERAGHASPAEAGPPATQAGVTGEVRAGKGGDAERRDRARRTRARARRIAARRLIVKRREKHFIWPVRRRITSRFGRRRSPVTGRREVHRGTDLACALGGRVLAPKDGRVLLAGRLPVYGRTVVIRHTGGWVTFMSHMRALAVGAGQRVRQGRKIGSCGASGWATGPHVHFELRRPSGRSIDPRDRMWRGRRR